MYSGKHIFPHGSFYMFSRYLIFFFSLPSVKMLREHFPVGPLLGLDGCN